MSSLFFEHGVKIITARRAGAYVLRPRHMILHFPYLSEATTVE